MRNDGAKIGDRVRYVGDFYAFQGVTGTIVKIFPADSTWHLDEGTGEKYQNPSRPSVKVDAIPKDWPYSGTDLFAPDWESIAKESV